MSFADDRHSAARKKMRARIANMNGRLNRLRLQPDEEEFIANNQGRCICCGHLEVFHSIGGTEQEICNIPGCECINGEARPHLPFTPDEIEGLQRLFSESEILQSDFGTVRVHPHPLFDKPTQNPQT